MMRDRQEQGDRLAIDPDEIPAEEYAIGCRVLAASIRHALADPATRAEYEDWKRRRAK